MIYQNIFIDLPNKRTIETNKMTKSQNQSLKESIERWNSVNVNVHLIGENEDGQLICTLETSHHIQYFLIGKKGAFTWKNKYIK